MEPFVVAVSAPAVNCPRVAAEIAEAARPSKTRRRDYDAEHIKTDTVSARQVGPTAAAKTYPDVPIQTIDLFLCYLQAQCSEYRVFDGS